MADGGDKRVLERADSRHVPTGILVIPGGLVSIGSDETLRWEIDYQRVTWKKPPATLLASFISLWRKKPSAMVAFAERWGTLRIDDFGSPVPASKGGSEPLAAWRFFSRRAYSVLTISKALRNGQSGNREDWAYLSADAGGNPAEFFGMPNWAMRGMVEIGGSRLPMPGANEVDLPVDRLCDQIAGELTKWLQRFSVQLSVNWSDAGDWRLQTQYSGGLLLSAIGMQLALAVADAESLYICAGCQSLYIRPRKRRKPNAGQGNFCDDCGNNRAPQRAAEKQYRENKREARRLAAEGHSVSEIADRLDKTTPVIRGWLKKRK